MENVLPEYDIVIVGAGPAGCITAHFLSKEYKVLLLDWSRFPRDKPCGGILVDESKKFLEQMKMPSSVFSYPKKFDIKYADFDNGFEVVEKRDFLNISRRSFDYWLLKLAEKNAQFLSETKFISFKDVKGGVEVLIERHNKKHLVKAKYLVGADGALSAVRAQISPRPVRKYFAMQEWVRSYSDVKELVFVYDSSINDYYSWIIPKGNYLLIGVAASPGDDLGNKIEAFEKKLTEKYKLYGRASKREGALSLRPQGKADCVLGSKNVMLVGEAAGLISPSSGEGISFALRSGFNCAKALNDDFGNAVKSYTKMCAPLVEEVDKKAAKANILANPEKRLEMLKAVRQSLKTV